ncbi:N-acetyltransferase family protein [Frateuria aurantia]
MIRRAVAADLPELIRLCRAHADYEKAPAETSPDADGLLSGFGGSQPELLVWVAASDARLVGYASGYPGFSTWHGRRLFHLDCIYLQEDFRGIGLGRALIQEVIDHAARHGCNHLEWLTPAWNRSAIGFYRHLGARVQTRRRLRFDILDDARPSGDTTPTPAGSLC